MRSLCPILTFLLFAVCIGCSSEKSHTAEAANDSVPFMTAHGISNLISDSGVVRYRLIAEEWLIYNATDLRPSRWDFLKGFFMQKYDDAWNTEWIIQSDTAYCHHDDLWELRGHVYMHNKDNTVFRTEELFWDMTKHDIYSSLFVHIKTPDRELQGYDFRSNEQMTKYTIYNSSGIVPVEDVDTEPQPEP